MKKIVLLTLTVVMLFAVVSCTTFKLSGAQVVTDIPSYQVVGDLDISLNVNEFIGRSGGMNLFNITSEAMDHVIYDAIQREIQKYSADAAVNVTIEYQASFVNLLLNTLTLGLYAPGTAVVSGSIVKY